MVTLDGRRSRAKIRRNARGTIPSLASSDDDTVSPSRIPIVCDLPVPTPKRTRHVPRVTSKGWVSTAFSARASAAGTDVSRQA